MTNEEVEKRLKEQSRTGEVAKHALGLMNKEIILGDKAPAEGGEDEDSAAGTDPSTFNPDGILTNATHEDELLINNSQPFSESKL